MTKELAWLFAADGLVYSWVPRADFVLQYTTRAFLNHCEGNPFDANDAAPQQWLPCHQFGERRDFVQWCLRQDRPRVELPRLRGKTW